MNVDKWITILTDPVGLTGFALFLVFTLLSKRKSKLKAKQKWVTPVFIVVAIAALAGGIWFSYVQYQKGKEPSPSQVTSGSEKKQIHQHTEGPQSPAVADTNGNVTININSKDEDKKEK